MTTPQDLLIIALDVPSRRDVGQGDLSLALAGAELADLLEAGALTLDGDRIVPGAPWATDDTLLSEAVSSLVREEPYESVEDWLWRRGRDLFAAYRTDLDARTPTGPGRRRWNPLRGGTAERADSPARRHAQDRWSQGDPVLVGLAAAVGIEHPDGEGAAPADGAVGTVLDAVHDAETELEAVRQRRSIENAAFDNIWRAP
ncbi:MULTISPECIES: GOLPH3/VPS74 family protein [unclassified Streptomyces]|uniref:GOLPH3/VPS74 family protein n=1 Tax=unclassified Streptomyces TaxID=2593676 RepID=UPI002E332E37|nr:MULTISPECIES: GPP34 family phosphoprotein [unclassified Streptomyces]